MASDHLHLVLATTVCLLLGGLRAAPALGEVETSDPVGRPKQYETGKAALCAVWYDDGVWHLRATNKKDRGHITIEGTVTLQGGGRLLSGELVGTENDDKGASHGKKKKKKAERNEDEIKVHSGDTGFDFRFGNSGGSDGLDFKVTNGAKTITFRIVVAGDDNPKNILIGADGSHPSKMPFVLTGKPQGEPSQK